MMSQKREIQLARPGDKIFVDVEGFVTRIYKAHGYIDHFEDSPDEYVYALNSEGEIIGAIGVFYGTFDELPSFSSGVFVPSNGLLRDKQKLVELGRFAIEDNDPNIAKAIIYHLYVYLMPRDYMYAICCLKPGLRKHLNTNLELFCQEYPAKLQLDKVPEIYSGYFTSEPHPETYYFSLDMLRERMGQIEVEIGAKMGTTFVSASVPRHAQTQANPEPEPGPEDHHVQGGGKKNERVLVASGSGR